MNIILKSFLIIIGTLFIILGTLGIFLPLLPTTPFLLLAAACYIRGSEKMYHWLINNKYFGSYIRNYREKKALPFRTKIIAVVLLWTAILYSAFFVIEPIYIKLIPVIIAVLVTRHILSLKTLKDDDSL
ncbi:MAG: YbaN family protein [Halanaerobiales bacterium]